MSMHSLIRVIAFFITFGVGAGTLTLSVLCDDLTRYFANKQILALEQRKLVSLQEKVKVYDALLVNIKRDPDVMHRIAPAVLGIQTEDPNTAYPLTGVQELAAARKVLQKDANADISQMPPWLTRCCEERRRTALFLLGGVLVLIAFACFGLVRLP
ncbi:MAG: hypothetical protein GY809_28790, partial [Planctomycetes bacterium]|nr:hypothetical protein [Planctomycetota bacterium]